jgi:DNA-binding transcriptional ArsR family regulator
LGQAAVEGGGRKYDPREPMILYNITGSERECVPISVSAETPRLGHALVEALQPLVMYKLIGSRNAFFPRALGLDILGICGRGGRNQRGSAGAHKKALDFSKRLYSLLVMDTLVAENDTSLDAVFAALADPTRRAIVERLARGTASVNELAEPFRLSQPAISKHLKVLERAGLISQGREAQRRPRKLEPQRIKQLSDWVATYREYLEASYERLENYLQTLQNTDRSGPADPAGQGGSP